MGFKPCYKWNAFNTFFCGNYRTYYPQSFKPCYKWNAFNTKLNEAMIENGFLQCFKHCYKWNAFNTE